MFSSSFLTAKPATAAPTAESAKNGAVLSQQSSDVASNSAADKSAASEDTGSFAKEYQAASDDHKSITKEQASATSKNEPKTEKEAEQAIKAESAAEVKDAETERSESNKSLTENSKAVSGQLPDEQSGQNSASEHKESDAELDSSSKQQIMSDGEELLSRLSESNKQLTQPAADSTDGKDLPLSDSELVKGSAQKEQEVLLSQGDGKAPVNRTGDAVEADIDVSVETGTSDEQAESFGNKAMAGDTKGQPEGLSQEQLAKVFAGPVSEEAAVGQEALSASQPAARSAKSDSASADLTEDTTSEAPAFAMGSTASAVATEIKNMQQAPQQSGDMLQSAGAKAAELNPGAQASAELPAELKAKLESVFASGGAANAAQMHNQAALAEANSASAGSLAQASLTQNALAQSQVSAQLQTVATTPLTAGMALPEGAVAEGESNAAGTAALAAALDASAPEGGKAEAKPDMAQTISGLTTSQGQVMARAEAAQAAQAESPLQLSKEQAGDQLAERVQMMMSKNLKHVDIRLDPPELGKLQIKLSLNQDQASVQFTVGNQQTRDLVEQAMPRLRELLNQQGLQLAQSSVQQDNARQQFAGQSNQHAQDQQSGGEGQQGHGSSRHGDTELGGAEPVDMYVSQSSDRVDYYA